MVTAYSARIVDQMIAEAIEAPSAILIEGPRASGKSATGKHHAKSTVQLDIETEFLTLADLSPEILLQGDKPRFIDEWQLAPIIWNLVRAEVDTDPLAAYILAGSSHPSDDVTRHSGAGRIQRIRMRPMSLHESGHSTQQVSLKDFFNEPTLNISGTSNMSVPDLAEVIVRGGWPGLRTFSLERVMNMLSSYIDDIARVDIPNLIQEPRRDPDGVIRLIRSLARNVSTEVGIALLARDSSHSGITMTDVTASNYLKALERVFVSEDQPSWGPHLRSRAQARNMPKRHFVDPSLAAAATGTSPERLLKDLEYFGLLFESLVIRDLRIYAAPVGAEVKHYRDSSGREVDAIVEKRDGNWIAIEVKLASSREEEAANSLKKFVENLDTKRTAQPSALVIITGGKYAYTRKDGIHVVPLGVLGA